MSLKIGGPCRFYPQEGQEKYIKGVLEEYLPDDPHFCKRPFGVRLANGNFTWTTINKIKSE